MAIARSPEEQAPALFPLYNLMWQAGETAGPLELNAAEQTQKTAADGAPQAPGLLTSWTPAAGHP